MPSVSEIQITNVKFNLQSFLEYQCVNQEDIEKINLFLETLRKYKLKRNNKKEVEHEVYASEMDKLVLKRKRDILDVTIFFVHCVIDVLLFFMHHIVQVTPPKDCVISLNLPTRPTVLKAAEIRQSLEGR